jgi:hypothetical protein
MTLPAIKLPPGKEYYSKYLVYVKAAGGRPLVKWFDEDWFPVGSTVRKEMTTLGLIRVIEGRVYDAA